MDICITTPLKILERVCLLANALADRMESTFILRNDHTDSSIDGMERVVCVPHAKVPIVKFWDPELQLACDMNVNNTLALENTRMIKTYVEIDERVRPLAMIVKQWTKRRILNDAGMWSQPRFTCVLLLLRCRYSTWWHPKLLYLDMPDPKLPTITEPPCPTFPPQKASRTPGWL